MKNKNIVRIFALLLIMGLAILFGFQANSQTASFFMESIEGKGLTPQTLSKAYTGPQTAQALMNAFNATYNRIYSKIRVIASFDNEMSKSELAIRGEIDVRYPRVEWLQMLLRRGITIENFDDYRIYLSKRHTLAFLEDHPNLRKIKLPHIPPTADWTTYKTAYIEKLVAKQQIERAKEQVERAKERIERAKVQVERTKKQFNSQQLEHAKKQFEHARKRLERARSALERTKTSKPSPNEPNRGEKKRSPYPAL